MKGMLWKKKGILRKGEGGIRDMWTEDDIDVF